jgi:hypothetical protein
MAANLAHAQQDALEEAQTWIKHWGSRQLLEDELAVLIEGGECVSQDICGSDDPADKWIMAR